jgi:hypothetical protein
LTSTLHLSLSSPLLPHGTIDAFIYFHLTRFDTLQVVFHLIEAHHSNRGVLFQHLRAAVPDVRRRNSLLISLVSLCPIHFHNFFVLPQGALLGNFFFLSSLASGLFG